MPPGIALKGCLARWARLGECRRSFSRRSLRHSATARAAPNAASAYLGSSQPPCQCPARESRGESQCRHHFAAPDDGVHRGLAKTLGCSEPLPNEYGFPSGWAVPVRHLGRPSNRSSRRRCRSTCLRVGLPKSIRRCRSPGAENRAGKSRQKTRKKVFPVFPNSRIRSETLTPAGMLPRTPGQTGKTFGFLTHCVRNDFPKSFPDLSSGS